MHPEKIIHDLLTVDTPVHMMRLILLFLLGLAIGNAHTTEAALTGQAAYFHKECREEMHDARTDLWQQLTNPKFRHQFSASPDGRNPSHRPVGVTH